MDTRFNVPRTVVVTEPLVTVLKVPKVVNNLKVNVTGDRHVVVENPGTCITELAWE